MAQDKWCHRTLSCLPYRDVSQYSSIEVRKYYVWPLKVGPEGSVLHGGGRGKEAPIPRC